MKTLIKTLMMATFVGGLTTCLMAQGQASTPGSTPPAGKQDTEARHPYFKAMDANQDGQVSLDEFVSFRLTKVQARASQHGRTIDANVCTAAITARFKEIDTNGDGFISLSEWETWYKAHPHHGAKGCSQRTPATSGSSTTGQTLK